jgi:hypothetical protein
VKLSHPATEIIRRRFSCREYRKRPLAKQVRRRLQDFLFSPPRGLWGTPVRFRLEAATEQDPQSLRGLGTYGFIRHPPAFILGASRHAEKDLEDFGYAMECIILFATELGLGTCWLGGTFTKSRFARRMGLRADETMPAVVSVGAIAAQSPARRLVMARRPAEARRLPWERIFFNGDFDTPLLAGDAGAFVTPLEMVRIAPSASNQQPWRIVRQGAGWHFYMRRTRGYSDGLGFKLVGLADLQRVDIGIAMSHFELSCQELKLGGEWAVQDPAIPLPDGLTHYVVSWRGG